MSELFFIGYRHDPNAEIVNKKVRVPASSLGDLDITVAQTVVDQKKISQTNLNNGYFKLVSFPKTLSLANLDSVTDAIFACIVGGVSLTYGVDFFIDDTYDTPRFVWGSDHPSSSYTELYPLHDILRLNDVIVCIYNK